jgi:hypothetical protein
MPNFEDDSGNCHAPDPNGVACYKSRIGCPIHPRKKRKAMSDIQTLRAENERLRDVLRRVSVHPSGDRMVKIAFVSEGCMVTYPVCPQTTWSLEALIEFDKVRREALEGKP